MATYLYVDNYRGFTGAVVPLRRVNFMVGENSTGKSSLLDLLDIFNDFGFWFLDPSLHTSALNERHFLDLVSASSENLESFTVGAVQVASNSEEISYGVLVTYANREWRAVPKRVSLIYGDEIRTIDETSSNSGDVESYLSRKKNVDLPKLIDETAGLMGEYIAIHKSDSDFDRRDSVGELRRMSFYSRYSEFFYANENLRGRRSEPPEPFSRPFYELAPIRTKPRRTYDAPQTSFSPEGDHIPYLIKRTLNSKKSKDGFVKFLREIGDSSGLFKDLSVKNFGDDPLAPFEMKVGLENASLSLQNVGYGVSQALPVLVEVFVRSPGSFFSIQQPEVHLHPRAQAAFGDVIANLAREEKKIFFVETHSDFTIDRFRLNVRKAYQKEMQDIKIPDDYPGVPNFDGRANGGGNEELDDYFSQVLFFERDEKGNHVTSIPILKNGNLSVNQPESYRSFFLHEGLSLL